MSPVPPRRTPGRRRRRRRPGRRVSGRGRNRALPLGGALDLAIAPERRPRRRRGRSVALHGFGWRVRAGADGGRGLGTTRSSSAAKAARTTPNSSPRAARNLLPTRRAGALSFRPLRQPAPPPRQGAPLAQGLPMAFVPTPDDPRAPAGQSPCPPVVRGAPRRLGARSSRSPSSRWKRARRRPAWARTATA